LDNIFTERLWRSVKYEEVYLNEYLNPRETRLGLARYFDFYNHQRPHQALDYLTPATLYFQPAPGLIQQSNFNGWTSTGFFLVNERVAPFSLNLYQLYLALSILYSLQEVFGL